MDRKRNGLPNRTAGSELRRSPSVVPVPENRRSHAQCASRLPRLFSIVATSYSSLVDSVNEQPQLSQTPLKQCVYKWCDGGALRQHEEHAEKKQRDQNWHHPPALVRPEEREQFSHDSETLTV